MLRKKVRMARIFNVVLAFSLFVWVSSAPHHHHFYKTVYLGGEDAGHVDVGGSGSLSVSASISGSGGAHKHEVVSEKVIDVEVPPAPEVKAQKTVIERTVIPQYVEKIVRVPSYVEKTIRVPSYVEKKVKVPVEPAIVEKTISHEQVPVEDVKVKTVVTKDLGYAADRHSRARGDASVYVGGASHGEGFFDRIFNIPIQTLGAVNGFLNGLGGSGHVSAGISKSFHAY